MVDRDLLAACVARLGTEPAVVSVSGASSFKVQILDLVASGEEGSDVESLGD